MRWIIPGNCDDDMMLKFGRQLAQAELLDPDFFPDLRDCPDLVMASDYAGEHAGSDYQVAVFLLTNRLGIMQTWEAERLMVRQKYLVDGRRIAFKKLTDRALQKALGPFLNATQKMNGIVFCAAIDKSLLDSNFGYQFNLIGAAKPLILAKLTRIAVLGSMLVGGLSNSGQNLHWITDDDEIVSNEVVCQEAGAVISAMMNRNCPKGMEVPCLGIAGKFEDNRRAEDLCAIPDLVGGAMAEMLTAIDKATIPRESDIVTPVLGRTSTKSKLVFSWFAGLKGPLKKLFCLVRAAPEGQVLISFADPSAKFGDNSTRQLILPPDKGWRDSIRHW